MGKYLVRKKQTNTNWWIGLLTSFLVCAFYAALVSFKTMPISEGWYSEYAWLINNGSVPYRDFEYLFFPLYMFIIAGFTNIFGYSIVALRILGIFVYGGIGVAVYCIFSKLFDNISGLTASFVTTLFLQSEVGQLFYDYIRFHDLFAMTATFFLLKVTIDGYHGVDFSINRLSIVTGVFTQYLVPAMLIAVGGMGLITNPISDHPVRGLGLLLCLCVGLLAVIISLVQKKTTRDALQKCAIPVSAILCGIFAAMECMVKQSNGTLMIVMIAIYLLYCAVVLENKSFVKAFCGAVAGVIFAFSFLLIYLLATESLDDFIRCCFGTALSAKGGLMKALFGWIWPNVCGAITRVELWIVALTIYAGFILFQKKEKSVRMPYSAKWVILIAAAMCVVTWMCVNNIGLASRLNSRNDTYIPGLVFFPCMFFFFVYAFYLLWQWMHKYKLEGVWEEYLPVFPVLGAIFAQGYGSGMSGGLATSQTAMAIGLIAAFCIHAALCTKARTLLAWVMSMTLLISGTFISRKTIQYYDWWGLTQGSLAEHTEEVDVPMLAGIKMRPMDKLCYETVYNDVVNNTEAGDTIFVFPHAPVFYTMTDRHSVTYSQVQWFDVSSVSSIEHDIQALKDTLPRMLVYVAVPDWVYEGHESAFSTYQTRQMRDFLLNELVPQHGYTILNQVDIGNDFYVTTYLLPH